MIRSWIPPFFVVGLHKFFLFYNSILPYLSAADILLAKHSPLCYAKEKGKGAHYGKEINLI